MPQPPNRTRLRHVLDRARVLHGDDVAEAMAESFLADWEAAADEGPHTQALYAAAWQLVRAAKLRDMGATSVANMHDHLAEACILGWRDELTVQTTAVEDTAP